MKRDLVAVVTADIIGSTRYSALDRRRVDALLRRAFRDAERRYPEAVHTRMAFRITTGDEFQWVMSDVPRTFDVLMYLRAVAASAGLVPGLRFRASIGHFARACCSARTPILNNWEAFPEPTLSVR